MKIMFFKFLHAALLLHPAQLLRYYRLTGGYRVTIMVILLQLSHGLLPAAAQPSGGPYGPIRQKYELPNTPGKIYYVAPEGHPEESGEALARPTTLKAAIERVKTGDAIVLRGGIYRTGNLILNQGITIQPYAGEEPVLKGTLIASAWTNLNNGLWKTSWPHLFYDKPAEWWNHEKFGKETPLYRFNNDMVFIDGKLLEAVGQKSDVDENSFYVEYETGFIYTGTDPSQHVVEITAFDTGIKWITGECHNKRSDGKGPVIRGITFTQYAYSGIAIEGTEPVGLSPESAHGKEITASVIEHCTISFCARVGIFLKGDHSIFRHCRVSDTGTDGLYITSSSDVLLEKNIFTRNNIEKINGYYPAAVKIFNQCYRVTCRDNQIIDLPHSNGVWYDVGNVDGRFINNWVEDVGTFGKKLDADNLMSDNGFFFEISKGAICADNVFVNCVNGILALNSSGVQAYQNTFCNSAACFARTGRTPGNDSTFNWHSVTGPAVEEREGHVFVNNLVAGDNRPLLLVWQPDSLCKRLNRPQLKHFDHNTFVRSAIKQPQPLILWSPATSQHCLLPFESPDGLQKIYPESSANNKYFINENGPLFMNADAGNYQLSPAFSGYKSASFFPLPAEAARLLGHPEKGVKYIGAYPTQ